MRWRPNMNEEDRKRFKEERRAKYARRQMRAGSRYQPRSLSQLSGKAMPIVDLDTIKIPSLEELNELLLDSAVEEEIKISLIIKHILSREGGSE